MSRNPLVADIAVAAVIVVFILIIEPGVAIAAILALVLFVICGASYVISRRRSRSVSVPPRTRRR